jgi:serine protease inhibitor
LGIQDSSQNIYMYVVNNIKYYNLIKALFLLTTYHNKDVSVSIIIPYSDKVILRGKCFTVSLPI